MNSCHLFDDLYGNNLSDEKRFRIQTISGALEKKSIPFTYTLLIADRYSLLKSAGQFYILVI